MGSMPISLRTLLLTSLAMIAFAANSILGRLGLVETEIGAGTFAGIRILSGAVILVLICRVQGRTLQGSWTGGLSLLAYAVCFSYAYIALPAGLGAIILFAMVQFTMLSWGFAQGERFSALQSLGSIIAGLAFIWLLSPRLDAPPLWAAIAMMAAGIGWGVYSLRGRGVHDPTGATAGNFVYATVLAVPVLTLAVWLAPEPVPAFDGAGLAILSGAVTSGLGYVIWYQALKGLTATRAGIAQLTVPAIAALGGIVFLSEPVTWRFALASTAILLGVGLVVLTGSQRSSKAKG